MGMAHIQMSSQAPRKQFSSIHFNKHVKAWICDLLEPQILHISNFLSGDDDGVAGARVKT